MKNNYNKRWHLDREESWFKERLLDKLELKGKNILEISPRKGNLLRYAKEKGANVYGIDVFGNYIEELTREFGNNFVQSKAIEIKNINKVDFDIIIAWWSIQYMEENEFKNFINNSLEKLKDNGILIITTRAGDSFKNIHARKQSQSMQLNIRNIIKFLPHNSEISYFESISYRSMSTKDDMQSTFIITKGIYKNSNPEIYDYR